MVGKFCNRTACRLRNRRRRRDNNMTLRKKKTPRASQHYMGWRAGQKSLLLPVAGEFFLLTLPFTVIAEVESSGKWTGGLYLRMSGTLKFSRFRGSGPTLTCGQPMNSNMKKKTVIVLAIACAFFSFSYFIPSHAQPGTGLQADETCRKLLTEQ